ncbi:hypothetical protein [Sphingobacterium kitahiroshimense]|uniref:Uncharacterized protein n=1 Tax=Sphingobacterium kitahiroshimense TaxID=470446 RepID=A0ABV0BWT8_9SPHI
MEEDKLNMDTRIIAYDKHYGFVENPNDFNFEYNPHRLIVKNYALRKNDRKAYESYLTTFFPELAAIELKNFDTEVNYIRHFDNEELAAWLASNDIQVVESDISFSDPDAIFKMVYVPESESPTSYVVKEEDFILNRILPGDLIKEPNKTWINIKKPKF